MADSLDVSRRAAADSLRAQLSALGVTDPADLVKSEVMEDVPQLARFVLLRSLWHGAIDGWTGPGSLEQLPAAQRLPAAGADREDLVRLARAAAYEAVFATLDELDAGGDANVMGVEAGWVVTSPPAPSLTRVPRAPRSKHSVLRATSIRASGRDAIP
ncbi:hypothetical protein ACH4GK_34075 [Streptomyces rimosus]|uniref:hypothetical protein n=1 Tax=Streptomyces rimosus TaxID=1927 RepID=UPI001F19FF80|nr:hypothetical protein [Streptomyces rimosus]